MSPEKFLLVQDEYRRSKDRLIEIEFNTLDEYFGRLEEYSKILEVSIAEKKIILLVRALKFAASFIRKEIQITIAKLGKSSGSFRFHDSLEIVKNWLVWGI